MTPLSFLLPFAMTVGLVLLALHEMRAMQVFVRTATGKMLTLEVERYDSIRRVKSKIRHLQGGVLLQQRLVFANTVLDDDHSISDYKIRGRSTLQLVG